jgi:hypothetical protein
MKPFELDPSMMTMGGVFYPTGHLFLMFPTQDQAKNAGKALVDAGFSADSMSLLTPEVIQGKITRTVGNADIPLPSAGTEADTVRVYADLASDGHYGLLVDASKAEDSDRVMEVLKDSGYSVAKKYRQLVIQDMD